MDWVVSRDKYMSQLDSSISETGEDMDKEIPVEVTNESDITADKMEIDDNDTVADEPFVKPNDVHEGKTVFIR